MPITPNTQPEVTVDKNGKTTTVHKSRSAAAPDSGGRAAKLTLPPAPFAGFDESGSDKALAEFSDVLAEMIAHEDAKAMSYNKNIAANIDSGFAAIRTYKEAIDSICRQSVFKDFASKLRDMTDVGSEQKLAILDWQLASRSKNAVKAVQENPSQDSIAILSAVSELQATIAMARFNARK